jgi:hypothetical protein
MSIQAKKIIHKSGDYTVTDMFDCLVDTNAITPLHRLVIKARMSGQSFFELNDVQKKQFIEDLINKIASTTGSELRTEEGVAEQLFKDVKSILTENGNSSLTFDEVSLALRFKFMEVAVSRAATMDVNFPEIKKVVYSGYLIPILSVYQNIRRTMEAIFNNKIVDGWKKKTE